MRATQEARIASQINGSWMQVRIEARNHGDAQPSRLPLAKGIR